MTRSNLFLSFFVETAILVVMTSGCTVQNGDEGAIDKSSTTPVTIREALAKASQTLEEKWPDSRQIRLRKHFYVDPRGETVLHGDYVEWHASGSPLVQGRYEHGMRIGVWKAWHAGGQKWCEGVFDGQGAPRGTWVYWDESNQEAGRRVDGTKEGRWKEWSEQRDCMGEGEYKKGKLEGAWVFFDRSGRKVCEMTFLAGVLHGDVILHAEERLDLKMEYGKERPAARTFHHQDKIYRGDDAEFGEAVSEPAMPALRDFYWTPQDGPFDPPTVYVARQLWPSGALRQETEFRLVTDKGRVVRVGHGRTARWRENGQIEREHAYKDGIEHGEFSAWYANGKRRFAVTFSNGVPTGRWRFWHANGNRMAECEIPRNGTLGPWEFWDPAGRPTKVNVVEAWVQEQLGAEDS